MNVNCGGYWWSTEKTVFFLNWSTDAAGKNDGVAGGFSVRCVKD